MINRYNIYILEVFCRFQFLMEFLEYLRRWKESTENRPGNYSQNTRARMLLSWQTYEGFQLTVQSTIESTKFLLQEGMDYVLTEHFCQDPVEEFFGKQRQLGRRSDNPDINQFGYNSNIIRTERSISFQSCHFIFLLSPPSQVKNLHLG